MVFSSLIFIFVYLPIVLLVYYLCPVRLRNVWLFAVNLIFYGWGEPAFVFLMLFTTVANYFFGLGIGRFRQSSPKRAKAFLIGSLVLDLGLLGYFKYANLLGQTLNLLPFLSVPKLTVALPIGISFYTFQIMSYTIDLYRMDATTQHNIIDFGTYVFLFPQLIAGPIVRYRDIAKQLSDRKETIVCFQKGVFLFCIGLSKKVLIANQMGQLWEGMQQTSHIGVVGSWVGLLAFAFQIYFDFSGYSDMARGLGNMLGFEFMKNFEYPYISKTITEFWHRWHISLSTWFRDYVYIPLGGNRYGIARQIFNLLIVWFLTGLWHGASYNFVLWGLYYAILLILEKFVVKRLSDRLPTLVKHIYTLFFVLLGWVIFYFEDMSQMQDFLFTLFGAYGFFPSNSAIVLIVRYVPLLAVSTLASCPLVSRVYLSLQKTSFYTLCTASLCMFSLFVCTCALVSQSYNPFLYFRF